MLESSEMDSESSSSAAAGGFSESFAGARSVSSVPGRLGMAAVVDGGGGGDEEGRDFEGSRGSVCFRDDLADECFR